MNYLDESKYENPAPVILSLCDHSGAWSRPFLEAGYIVVRVDPKHGAVDHGGTGYTVGAAGNGALVDMPDGGVGLGLTAGALADILEDESGYFLDNLLWPHYSGRANGRGYYDCCEVAGVLIAAPCTDFANSGARWFAAKDVDGRTAASVSIVRDCLRVKELVQPDFWVLENPNGRIKRLVPELGDWLLTFDPTDYAGLADDPDREAYTKKTMLYGDFKTDLPSSKREPVYFTNAKGQRGSWQWAHLGGKSERTKELRSVTPTGFSRAFAYAQTGNPQVLVGEQLMECQTCDNIALPQADQPIECTDCHAYG